MAGQFAKTEGMLNGMIHVDFNAYFLIPPGERTLGRLLIATGLGWACRERASVHHGVYIIHSKALNNVEAECARGMVRLAPYSV